jgi:hypothetical protein
VPLKLDRTEYSLILKTNRPHYQNVRAFINGSLFPAIWNNAQKRYIVPFSLSPKRMLSAHLVIAVQWNKEFISPDIKLEEVFIQ